MKKSNKKQKIAFIISLIFFITSIAVKVKNLKENISIVSKNKTNDITAKKANDIKNKSINKNLDKNEVLDRNFNKDLNNSLYIKEYILKLSSTIGEAIEYIKINVNHKDKYEEIKTLIGDCTNALESIENVLNKSNDGELTNLLKDTQNIRQTFEKLKKGFNQKDLYKSEEIIKCSLEEEYKEWEKLLRNYQGN